MAQTQFTFFFETFLNNEACMIGFCEGTMAGSKKKKKKRKKNGLNNNRENQHCIFNIESNRKLEYINIGTEMARGN